MNMNAAHTHLLLNHFPLCTLIVATLVLLFGLLRRQISTMRVGFSIAILAGAFVIPTFLSGDPASDVLHDRPNYEKSFVQEHDEAATFGLTFTLITAVVSAGALFMSVKKNRIPKALLIAVVVLHLFTLTVLARVSYLGGLITHVEVR